MNYTSKVKLTDLRPHCFFFSLLRGGRSIYKFDACLVNLIY